MGFNSGFKGLNTLHLAQLALWMPPARFICIGRFEADSRNCLPRPETMNVRFDYF